LGDFLEEHNRYRDAPASVALRHIADEGSPLARAMAATVLARVDRTAADKPYPVAPPDEPEPA
jgi:hypothetical protein